MKDDLLTVLRWLVFDAGPVLWFLLLIIIQAIVESQ